MNKYQSHPHVPRWIEAMNGELLSPAELDVLDFIYWCKKHGCRTSNDRIGKRTHRSHWTVQEAIQKFYRLNLVTIKNYGKRTRTIRPVFWADRQAWESLDSRAIPDENNPVCRGIPDKNHPAGQAPHIPRLDETPSTRGSSLGLSEPPTTGEKVLPQGDTPRTPRCGSRGGKKTTYQLEAELHRDRMVQAGWSSNQANRLALVKYPNAEF